MEKRPQIHIRFGNQAKPEDIAPYVIVPSSFEMVNSIVEHMEDVIRVASHYEWLVYTGKYKGTEITICSTGIGAASVSIAIEELTDLGVHTFLRTGYADSLETESAYEGLVIASGAMRLDGISDDYVRPEYPAPAHYEAVLASIYNAEKLGLVYKVNVIASCASKVMDNNVLPNRYRIEKAGQIRNLMAAHNVNEMDGESATLFVAGAIYGLRCGTINILPIADNNNRLRSELERNLIRAGLETIKTLHDWDKHKENTGIKYIHPMVDINV